MTALLEILAAIDAAEFCDALQWVVVFFAVVVALTLVRPSVTYIWGTLAQGPQLTF